MIVGDQTLMKSTVNVDDGTAILALYAIRK